MRGCQSGLSEEGAGSLLCLPLPAILTAVVGVLGPHIPMEVGAPWELQPVGPGLFPSVMGKSHPWHLAFTPAQCLLFLFTVGM